jgi:hypothetical protein
MKTWEIAESGLHLTYFYSKTRILYSVSSCLKGKMEIIQKQVSGRLDTWKNMSTSIFFSLGNLKLLRAATEFLTPKQL